MGNFLFKNSIKILSWLKKIQNGPDEPDLSATHLNPCHPSTCSLIYGYIHYKKNNELHVNRRHKHIFLYFY